MNRFGAMLQHIASLADDGDRIKVLAAYLHPLEPEEQTAVIALLARPPRKALVALKTLRAPLEARIGAALFDLSLAHVGDLTETIALLWDADTRPNRPITPAGFLHGLSTTGPLERRALVEHALAGCDARGRLAILRLATGTRARLVPPGLLEASLEHLGRGHALAPVPPPTTQGDLFANAPENVTTPGTLTALLMYVETTRGARPRLLCTFGVTDGEVLLPVARLDAGDFRKAIADFARTHPGRRFGTTQEVDTSGEDVLLATLSWTGIARAPRRRAGIELQQARLIAIEAPARRDRSGTLATLTSRLPSPRTRG